MTNETNILIPTDVLRDMAKVETAFWNIRKEHDRAISKFKPFNSAHEGYSVILEELDELWEEVKKKRSKRNSKKMYNEAKQVAAMALRFMVDIGEEE